MSVVSRGMAACSLPHLQQPNRFAQCPDHRGRQAAARDGTIQLLHRGGQLTGIAGHVHAGFQVMRSTISKISAEASSQSIGVENRRILSS